MYTLEEKWKRGKETEYEESGLAPMNFQAFIAKKLMPTENDTKLAVRNGALSYHPHHTKFNFPALQPSTKAVDQEDWERKSEMRRA